MNPFGNKSAGAKQTTAAPTPNSLETVQKGLTSVIDLISPSSVEVDFRYIRIGEMYYTTLFIAGYPRYVSPGWLQSVIDYDHTMNISMFCYPTQSTDVLSDLKRKIAEMQATIAGDEEKGKAPDPTVTAALEDALGLQEELAKGIERFFQFGFYISISDASLPKLTQTVK